MDVHPPPEDSFVELQGTPGGLFRGSSEPERETPILEPDNDGNGDVSTATSDIISDSESRKRKLNDIASEDIIFLSSDDEDDGITDSRNSPHQTSQVPQIPQGSETQQAQQAANHSVVDVEAVPDTLGEDSGSDSDVQVLKILPVPRNSRGSPPTASVASQARYGPQTSVDEIIAARRAEGTASEPNAAPQVPIRQVPEMPFQSVPPAFLPPNHAAPHPTPHLTPHPPRELTQHCRTLLLTRDKLVYSYDADIRNLRHRLAELFREQKELAEKRQQSQRTIKESREQWAAVNRELNSVRRDPTSADPTSAAGNRLKLLIRRNRDYAVQQQMLLDLAAHDEAREQRVAQQIARVHQLSQQLHAAHRTDLRQITERIIRAGGSEALGNDLFTSTGASGIPGMPAGPGVSGITGATGVTGAPSIPGGLGVPGGNIQTPNVAIDVDSDDVYNSTNEWAVRMREGMMGQSYSRVDPEEAQQLEKLLDNIRPDEEMTDADRAATPAELEVTLLPHQRIGLSWMLRMEASGNRGGILADDMGLGKTLQAISLILASNAEYRKSFLEKEKEKEKEKEEEKGKEKLKKEENDEYSKEQPTGNGNAEKINGNTAESNGSNGSVKTEVNQSVKPETKREPLSEILLRDISDDEDVVVIKTTTQAAPVTSAAPKAFTGNGKSLEALAKYGMVFGKSAAKPKVPRRRPTLIITPVALCRQWFDEFMTKIQPEHHLKVYVHHGDSRTHQSFRRFAEYDVVITTYGIITREFNQHFRMALQEAQAGEQSSIIPDLGSADYLRGSRGAYRSPFFEKDARFLRVILDEAQAIKNKNSKAARGCSLLQADCRWCLTGTPMQNSVDELYSLLRFLRISPYNDYGKFSKDIGRPIRSAMERSRAMRKLQALLKAIFLRRLKTSEIDGKPILQLPEKQIIEGKVEMPEDERAAYSALEAGAKKRVEKMLNTDRWGGNSYSNILVMLLRLRQACDHQLLVRLGEERRSQKDGVQAVDEGSVAAEVDRIERLSQNARQRLVESAESFVCPVCFEVTDGENMAVLVPCGHAVCNDCVSQVFERAEMPGERGAKCVACGGNVAEGDVVSYQLFYSYYVEKKSLRQLEAEQKAAYSERLTVAQIVQRGEFEVSAKMKACFDLVKKIFTERPDEKVIVFSQFTSFFDLLQQVLNKEDIPFLRYDGSMNAAQRNAVLTEFKQDPSVKLIIVSLKAGNVGLTLTVANHVIIMDPFWNPYVEDQAMDRVHRIGQKKPVFVHKLLVPDTVEDRIVQLQQAKRELITTAMDEGNLRNISKLGRKELAFLFGLGDMN